MALSLPLRINLYSLVFALLVATVLTALGGAFLHHQQGEAATARARIAADELAHRASRLLDLDLQIRDFLNFDEQCAAVIRGDPLLREAAVFDEQARQAFHSKRSQLHWPVGVAPQDSGETLSLHTPQGTLTLRPILRGKSQVAGYAAVLVDAQAVLHETLRAVSWLIASALGLFAAGLAIQQALLWRAIGRPLAGLVRTADNIRPDGLHALPELPLLPEVHPDDDIGRLYGAFARLMRRLLDARAELVAHNEQLEATVRERTAQLATVNAELARDIERRKFLEAELRARANTDSLTGLANRSFIMGYLDKRIHDARRNQRLLGVMLLDFDGFKVINDHYGHAAGDEALRVLSARMAHLTRNSDLLARLGGDEFLLAFEGFEQREQAELVARRLMTAFDSPIPCDTHMLQLGVSIGIAVFPWHGNDLNSVLAAADTAMYEAKRLRAGVCFARPRQAVAVAA